MGWQPGNLKIWNDFMQSVQLNCTIRIKKKALLASSLSSNLLCFVYFQVVTSLADPSANIIFGAVVDDRYNGEIHVTIIATGFSQSFQKTLLTDPKAAKLLDKAAGSPLKTPTSPSTVNSRPPPRKLFF